MSALTLGSRSSLLTHTGHELEDRVLRFFVQVDSLVHCSPQAVFWQIGLGHSLDQREAKVVIDVQLARRARSKEGIVQI